MDESDRASILAELFHSREALRNSVSGLSEAQARFKPSADRWSIEEIVEHVAIAEHGMYRLITAYHQPCDDSQRSISAASLARMSDRKKRPFVAPERVVPKNRFGSLNAALEKFLESRERTIEFVKSCPDDLRLRMVDHPAGRMNGRDCMKVICLHPARHVEQINELKADPAYPRPTAG